LVISDHNSFRVLSDKNCFRVILFQKYILYFNIGNGQPGAPALCQLYRHTFVPNVAYKLRCLYLQSSEGFVSHALSCCCCSCCYWLHSSSTWHQPPSEGDPNHGPPSPPGHVLPRRGPSGGFTRVGTSPSRRRLLHVGSPDLPQTGRQCSKTSNSWRNASPNSPTAPSTAT